jgi:hypothetical protein
MTKMVCNVGTRKAELLIIIDVDAFPKMKLSLSAFETLGLKQVI